MDDIALPKTEKANYIQSGFHCHACASHVKTYNGLIPTFCPTCGALGTLKMEWNQQLETTSIVTSLPLIDPVNG